MQERLRLPLTEQEPSEIRRRLADFYDAAIRPSAAAAIAT